MPTPTEPTSEGKRPRGRARKSAPDALRPEVAAALAGLERSIGDVAGWEHADAPEAEPGDGAAASKRKPKPKLELEPAPHISDLAVAAPPTAAIAGLELGLPAALPSDSGLPATAPEPDLDLGGLTDQPATEESAAFWAEAEAGRAGRSLSTQERRRRNGRILSWTGAALLVAVAAWLLLPGSASNKADVSTTTTSTEATTTTTTVSSIDGSSFPVPTTAVTVPDTTPTTAARSTATTVKRKVAATTTTTTVRPTTTTQAPTTTTTVRPTTTTTIPPTTTTTCAVGGIPDPEHGTC